MKHELTLQGCAPEPLMSYLKALGIFRLVAKQQDAGARAWWEADSFILRSTLDRNRLEAFFLDEYRPTPVVSPWNGGSGFDPKDNAEAITVITGLNNPRFRIWNETIQGCRQILDEVAQADVPNRSEAWKRRILLQCRNRLPDPALEWLDATYVLTATSPKYLPLLGSGGNDGRLEFGNNFMQNVVSALNLDQQNHSADAARNQIRASLFADASPELIRKRSSGPYNPGGVGGANASVGFSRAPLTNPWDYVLMMEGAITFAGAAARRLSAAASTKASFPFTVDSSAAGYSTAVAAEYSDASRAEFWAPIWSERSNFQELERFVAEGRAQYGRKQAANGANFARAVAGLGVERGVTQFQRYGFLARHGRNYLAAPLGRFHTRNTQETVERSNVLFDLDPWLERFRTQATGRDAPEGIAAALRQIDTAIITFCQRGNPRDLQEVLIAVGQAERCLARSGLSSKVPPMGRLSPDWLEHSDDHSAEFRLARAIASITAGRKDGQAKVGTIRENLEPVSTDGRIEWKTESVSFVWAGNNILSNMLAVLERRCIEGQMQYLPHPPLYGYHPAQANDVVSFLNGDLDCGRIASLALPLSFLRYMPTMPRSHTPERGRLSPPMPVAYATMKLTLLPHELDAPSFGITDPTVIKPESRMLAMLRAGRIDEAYQAAVKRLTATGLRPIANAPGISDNSVNGRRLAAALLFPIAEHELLEHALRRSEQAPNQS